MDFDYLKFLLNGQLNMRLDANETIAFSQAFREVLTQTYDVEYPTLKARQLFSLLSVSNTAREVTYRQFDKVVPEAEFISDYGDDFKEGDILGKEFTSKVKALGSGYSYSVQDLRDSAKLNMPLDLARAMVAREMIERKVDALIATGDSTVGLNGVFSSVHTAQYVTPTVSTWSTHTTWQDKLDNNDSANGGIRAIINDINLMQNGIRNATNQLREGNRLVLPSRLFNRLRSTPRSVLYTTDNLLDYVKAQTGISDIQTWDKLDTLAASNGYGRIFLYNTGPDVIQYVMGQEFEQMAPQVKNMKFSVACHARCGGVQVRYPKAVAILDEADKGTT
jgi:hypothetical protein